MASKVVGALGSSAKYGGGALASVPGSVALAEPALPAPAKPASVAPMPQPIVIGYRRPRLKLLPQPRVPKGSAGRAQDEPAERRPRLKLPQPRVPRGSAGRAQDEPAEVAAARPEPAEVATAQPGPAEVATAQPGLAEVATARSEAAEAATAQPEAAQAQSSSNMMIVRVPVGAIITMPQPSDVPHPSKATGMLLPREAPLGMPSDGKGADSGNGAAACNTAATEGDGGKGETSGKGADAGGKGATNGTGAYCGNGAGSAGGSNGAGGAGGKGATGGNGQAGRADGKGADGSAGCGKGKRSHNANRAKHGIAAGKAGNAGTGKGGEASGSFDDGAGSAIDGGGTGKGNWIGKLHQKGKSQVTTWSWVHCTDCATRFGDSEVFVNTVYMFMNPGGMEQVLHTLCPAGHCSQHENPALATQIKAKVCEANGCSSRQMYLERKTKWVADEEDQNPCGAGSGFRKSKITDIWCQQCGAPNGGAKQAPRRFHPYTPVPQTPVEDF